MYNKPNAQEAMRFLGTNLQKGKTKALPEVEEILTSSEQGGLPLDMTKYYDAKLKNALMQGIAKRKAGYNHIKTLESGDVSTAIDMSWGQTPLSEKKLDDISKSFNFLDRLEFLKQTLDTVDDKGFKEEFGFDLSPITGKLAKLVPWKTDAQVIKAQVNSLLGQFAKKIGGDAGTLSTQDIENARASIPDFDKTQDVNEFLFKLYAKAAAKASEREIKVLTYGHDTRPLKSLYQRTLQYLDTQPTSTETGGNQLSAQDQEAYNWAKSNPNDPRSAKILAKLGVK